MNQHLTKMSLSTEDTTSGTLPYNQDATTGTETPETAKDGVCKLALPHRSRFCTTFKSFAGGLVAAVALGVVVMMVVSSIFCCVYIRSKRYVNSAAKLIGMKMYAPSLHDRSLPVQSKINVKSTPNIYEGEKNEKKTSENPYYSVVGPVTMIRVDSCCNITATNGSQEPVLRNHDDRVRLPDNRESTSYAGSVLSVKSEPSYNLRASGLYSTNIASSECGSNGPEDIFVVDGSWSHIHQHSAMKGVESGVGAASILTTKSGPPLLPKPNLKRTRFDSNRNTTLIYSKSMDRCNVIHVHDIQGREVEDA
jgi:hypothetical protein